MAGKKRSVNGQVKPQARPQNLPEDTPMTNTTPPCGQPLPPSSKSTSTPTTAPESNEAAPHSTSHIPQEEKAPNPSKPVPQPRKPTTHKKLAKLPKNASISTRPLLHPALPTPHSSSASPKIIYITATTPYIPCVKRVRNLLTHITKREKQSAASLSSKPGRARGQQNTKVLEANGRLEAKDVERNIVEEASKTRGTRKPGEMVYLKATGRAIPRALEIALHFQADQSCGVRVDLGSVKAIDDIEIKSIPSTGTHEATGQEEQGQDQEADESIPETRIRMLSSVTVSIGLV
ncbi:ribonuclease p mrp subunit pop7 [Pyrenophora seminiperda CCB06]|uniref:Ribonuclease p mrp subunit pop7 n=1 Tax=Pyrenophora seminiperda CCB06 TaxID=1302712 RepID=A0A3M7MCT2_9PLEO|nr:ribonuclease p mrp subunit pop7 [Pyrenophora seminiperda CCB06]